MTRVLYEYIATNLLRLNTYYLENKSIKAIQMLLNNSKFRQQVA